MIKGIHHISLHTADFDRMLAFYVDVVGFEFACEIMPWSGSDQIDRVIGVKNSAGRFVMLNAGNCYLELFEYSSPAPRDAEPLRPNDRGYTHLALEVQDIETECERLLAAGASFTQDAPEDYGAYKAIYGKDPDGNVIEVIQTNPDHVFSTKHLKRPAHV